MVFRDEEPSNAKGSADYIRERQVERQRATLDALNAQALGLRMVHVGVAVLEMVYDNLEVINRETFHAYVDEAYDLFSVEEENEDND